MNESIRPDQSMLDTPSGFTFGTRSARGFHDTVEIVRSALAEQGFGIVSEIDLKKTFHTRLDKEIRHHLVLGACSAPFAYAVTQAVPSVAALIPCNVVVRELEDDTCAIEAFDPGVMASLAGEENLTAELRELAGSVRSDLMKAVASISA